jgi:primosomal protein N' (replication factor Y)
MNTVRDGSTDEVNKKVLLKRSGTTHSVLNQLIEKKVFSIVQRKEQDLKDGEKIINLAELAPNQQTAFQNIKAGFDKNKVVLLHGVTSSGKTEIYSRLISEMIKANKQVLYLLPEIALTAQIIQRLKLMFGDSLVVYHSRHNQRERATVYLKILGDGENGNYKYPIIIGARSAVFLPFKNLGLIIVDEEHESSYKQFDPAPRYHARDIAIVLGDLMKADVVLGSATPSLESYQNAVDGKYELVELKGRFGGIQSPELVLVDLAESYRRRLVKSHFSSSLLDEMKVTIDNGEQVILFQNRRGFAPVLECGNCGWIPHCINCDVSLTYHKRSNKMQCHYCGYSVSPQVNCEECKSHNVKMKGLGTERIEDNVLSFFPEMKVERLDLDTSSSKASFHRILTSFESGEIDVLVGTQMITKGLDFGNVGLVGVLNADNLINFPDFRASERSFQLLAQVAGRAGRRQKRGKVIVQAFNIEHPILKFLSRYDYKSFYSYESHERKLYNYPPFFRLIEFRLKHRNESGVEDLGSLFSQSLKNVFGKRILGPVIPNVSRVRNMYIRTVTMKVEKEYSNAAVKKEIHNIIENFRKTLKNRQLLIQIDVDPF